MPAPSLLTLFKPAHKEKLFSVLLAFFGNYWSKNMPIFIPGQFMISHYSNIFWYDSCFRSLFIWTLKHTILKYINQSGRGHLPQSRLWNKYFWAIFDTFSKLFCARVIFHFSNALTATEVGRCIKLGLGLVHIRRCHGLVRTQGACSCTTWPGRVRKELRGEEGGVGGMPAASTYYCRLKSSTQQPKVIKDGFGGGITKGVCVWQLCATMMSWVI